MRVKWRWMVLVFAGEVIVGEGDGVERLGKLEVVMRLTVLMRLMRLMTDDD